MPTPLDRALNSKVSPYHRHPNTRLTELNAFAEPLSRLCRPRDRSDRVVNLGQRYVPSPTGSQRRPRELDRGGDEEMAQLGKLALDA